MIYGIDSAGGVYRWPDKRITQAKRWAFELEDWTCGPDGDQIPRDARIFKMPRRWRWQGADADAVRPHRSY